MEVSWDQLDNMRQPVLSDWCDHIDRDLILNVLSVPRIRDLSGLDSSLVSSLWVDEGFVLLLLISWLDHRDNSIWALTDDILFATFLDVFEFDDSGLAIDVESLGRGSVIGTDLVAYREVVSLARDWGSQCSAEGVDDWWVSALGFAWLLEGLSHQGASIVG